ncbi:unnamed protein product [Adineta ricciae]|uniref:Uncharacterized protein n=1 Tax=Adineta ricciae TaxID=249248 RepID=A0A815TMJ3_ADIRI|nr:unnamed protein product [Adineta ricciae]
MFLSNYVFFYLILIQLVFTTPQLNLHFTDPIDRSENGFTLEHDCLRHDNSFSGFMNFCLSEFFVNVNLEENDRFPKYTFAQLSQENITSGQLLLWSAPIDLVEDYQFYLNQLSIAKYDLVLSKKVFSNCTLPRFGSTCQYEYDFLDDMNFPIYNYEEIVNRLGQLQITRLTCYVHLSCDRGYGMLGCLDWSEICDGHVNCLNGAVDEEHCWQLELNDCKDDEYRCHNGQCISWHFYRSKDGHDCLDRSDEDQKYNKQGFHVFFSQISYFEDNTCTITFLTSSCIESHHVFLIEKLLSMKDERISDDCSTAFICSLELVGIVCNNFNTLEENIRYVEEMCPDIIQVSSVPVLFGDIYMMYIKNISQTNVQNKYWTFYLCTNNSLYEKYFIHLPKIFFNTTQCYYHMTWLLDQQMRSAGLTIFAYTNEVLQQNSLLLNYSTELCQRSDMYQCRNSSKCISLYRLLDFMPDCPYADDEDEIRFENAVIQELFKRKIIRCPMFTKKYTLLWGFRPLQCTCASNNDEICNEDKKYLSHLDWKTIPFELTCDGFVDITDPVTNETDETNCDRWPCNNLYTRCDGIWNCLNGVDELSCDRSSPINCSFNQHICVSPQTSQLMCLPSEKINDGMINCLGGIDEPKICRRKSFSDSYNQFRCRNDEIKSCIDATLICDGQNDCLHGDDEQFCTNHHDSYRWINRCSTSISDKHFDINYFMCRSLEVTQYYHSKRFSLQIPTQTRSSLISVSNNLHRCHYGIDIRLWTGNTNKRSCLCPSYYYGDVCQYQNQRVSVSLLISAPENIHRIPFAIIISLIDNDESRIVHSSYQFTAYPTTRCYEKHRFYLTYSIRPKNVTKQYFIHMDFYEKLSLGYRGSLLFSISYPFLPVHRLSYYIHIPSNNETVICSDRRCLHGKCIRYFNHPEKATFCQCDYGWSGKFCQIPYRCLCSSDSICIGVSTSNRSICVCPVNRYGPRCFLIDTICQTNGSVRCQNGGQCIPINKDINQGSGSFICRCRKGFYGTRCESTRRQLILSFGKDISVTQSISIHILSIRPFIGPLRTTLFEMIPINQKTITIEVADTFGVLFIEFLQQKYYLITVDKYQNRTGSIIKTIHPSDRCRHISEIFNKIILDYPSIRRMKYYHLPCEKYSLDLSCFYDDTHVCLCYEFQQKYLANCFLFNHKMKFDCYGQNLCENNGQCFQHSDICPEKIICVCPQCFYGARCQFRTNGFDFSLDGILGYHIQPQVRLVSQPIIVQISVTVSLIILIFGLINGLCTLMTFLKKNVREVGCGYYLLGSSVTTLLIMISFAMKFSIFLLIHMSIVMNRTFILYQCRTMDFLFRTFLYTDQLLNSSVAIERAVTTVKGIQFKKKKSRQAVKYVIPMIFLLAISSNIHDPIHRRLITEENPSGTRIWCTVNYSSRLQTYNSTIHIIHFLVPFLSNMISSILLITIKSRQTYVTQTKETFKKIIQKQIFQRKHLLIAPIILVLLAIPRLIIAFTSKCSYSVGDGWLFLTGYFLTLIPPITTFLIFILPSKFYKKEFRKTIRTYRDQIQKHFTRHL